MTTQRCRGDTRSSFPRKAVWAWGLGLGFGGGVLAREGEAVGGWGDLDVRVAPSVSDSLQQGEGMRREEF